MCRWYYYTYAGCDHEDDDVQPEPEYCPAARAKGEVCPFTGDAEPRQVMQDVPCPECTGRGPGHAQATANAPSVMLGGAPMSEADRMAQENVQPPMHGGAHGATNPVTQGAHLSASQQQYEEEDDDEEDEDDEDGDEDGIPPDGFPTHNMDQHTTNGGQWRAEMQEDIAEEQRQAAWNQKHQARQQYAQQRDDNSLAEAAQISRDHWEQVELRNLGKALRRSKRDAGAGGDRELEYMIEQAKLMSLQDAQPDDAQHDAEVLEAMEQSMLELESQNEHHLNRAREEALIEHMQQFQTRRAAGILPYDDDASTVVSGAGRSRSRFAPRRFDEHANAASSQAGPPSWQPGSIRSQMASFHHVDDDSDVRSQATATRRNQAPPVPSIIVDEASDVASQASTARRSRRAPSSQAAFPVAEEHPGMPMSPRSATRQAWAQGVRPGFPPPPSAPAVPGPPYPDERGGHWDLPEGQEWTRPARQSHSPAATFARVQRQRPQEEQRRQELFSQHSGSQAELRWETETEADEADGRSMTAATMSAARSSHVNRDGYGPGAS